MLNKCEGPGFMGGDGEDRNIKHCFRCQKAHSLIGDIISKQLVVMENDKLSCKIKEPSWIPKEEEVRLVSGEDAV